MVDFNTQLRGSAGAHGIHCRLHVASTHIYILDGNADQVHEDDPMVELATDLADLPDGENRRLISKNKRRHPPGTLVTGCVE
jgi:hypothetical protein